MSLDGRTSSLIKPIKEDLGYLLSLIEVNIDYPEYEDLEEVNYEKIIELMDKNIDYIRKLIKDGKKGNIIRDGISIAIVGKPNVGKSSILNALINEDKAIVSDIKGTTRDIVEGKFILNGILINLFDTAGIRESEDLIEGIGINKSIDKLEKADLIIGEKEINVSALNKEVEELKKAILSFLSLDKENYENPSISNVRELGVLESILEIMEKVRLDAKNSVSLDLLSADIKEMYLLVLSLTGEDHDFDIASEIFSRFCVGK